MEKSKIELEDIHAKLQEIKRRQPGRGALPKWEAMLCIVPTCFVAFILVGFMAIGVFSSRSKISTSCEFELQVLKETQALRSRVMSALN